MNETTDRSHDWAILTALTVAYARTDDLGTWLALAEWEETMIDLA